MKIKELFFSSHDLKATFPATLSHGASLVDLLQRTFFGTLLRRPFSLDLSPEDLLWQTLSVGPSPTALISLTFSDGPSPAALLPWTFFSYGPSSTDLILWTHSSKSRYRSLTLRVLRRIGLGVSISYRSIRKLKKIKS